MLVIDVLRKARARIDKPSKWISYWSKSNDGKRLGADGAIWWVIVDDVLTTGESMEEMRLHYSSRTIGVVLFARGKCPDWVTPIFSLCSDLKLVATTGDR